MANSKKQVKPDFVRAMQPSHEELERKKIEALLTKQRAIAEAIFVGLVSQAPITAKIEHLSDRAFDAATLWMRNCYGLRRKDEEAGE